MGFFSNLLKGEARKVVSNMVGKAVDGFVGVEMDSDNNRKDRQAQYEKNQLPVGRKFNRV